jgi:hypothetical protein
VSTHVVTTWAELAAALPGVGPGDTVFLDAPTFSGNSEITWSAPPNTRIIGRGLDETFVTDDLDVGSSTKLLTINVHSTGVFRMLGITFQSGSATIIKDNGTVVFNGPGNLEIGYCRWDASSTVNSKAFYIGLGMRGVLHSSTLDLVGTNAVYFYNGRVDAQGNYEWAQPTGFGSDDFFFIEDCLVNGSVGSGAYSTRLWDAFTGAKMVARFNTLSKSAIGETHNTGNSGDVRGARAQEMYCNYTLPAPAYDEGLNNQPNRQLAEISNGSGYVWGNSVDGAYQTWLLSHITRRNTATYAQAIPPDGWGHTGPIASGTVNVSGTTVTKVSGDDFDVSWEGAMIYIAGAESKAVHDQRPGYNAICGVATVVSPTELTLTNGGHIGSDLTGAAFVLGSLWDGNEDSTGYPALDQPGRGQGDLLTGSFPNKINDALGVAGYPRQALEPIRYWANSGSIVSGWGSSTQYAVDTQMVQVGRDFYPQASGIQTSPTSPFNGTSGNGWGTLANRPPAPVTPGVGYWVMDEGSWNQSTSNARGVNMAGASGRLYVANAEGQWELKYEPYIYPHPLRSDLEPAAPSFLSHPQPATKIAGENHTFSVSVLGTPFPEFQWRKGGVNISGATSSSLALTNLQTSDAGSYDCVITNTEGTATSNSAVLSVSNASGGASRRRVVCARRR